MATPKESAFLAPIGKGLTAIADALLARPSPAVHTLRLRGLPSRRPTRIHYVARHADVINLLRGPQSRYLNVSHNDRAMQSATRSPHGPLDFLLGDPHTKKVRWAILRDALALPPAMDRRDGADFAPYAGPAVAQALEFARGVRMEADGRFDGVNDYGRIAAALAASAFTGLELPLPGQPLDKRAARFMQLNFAIFGQVFGNLDDRNPVLRGIARLATKVLRRNIRNSARTPRDGSLLARVRAVRHLHPGVSDAEFEREATALVYEIAGTIQILVTTSFSNMIQAAGSGGMSIGTLAAHLAENIHAVDEALRLVPTSPMLSRIVEQPFSYGGTRFEPGDYVCALTAAAGRDPDAFPQPELFAEAGGESPARPVAGYTNFGPNEVGARNPFNSPDHTHPCFGQYWARHLLRAMVEGLAGLGEVRLAGPAKAVAGMPSRLPLHAPLSADERMSRHDGQVGSQNLYTVLTDIRLEPGEDRREVEADLRERIGELGNPAGPDVERALRDTGLIHFASLSVVPGVGAREPSFLVLEFSADGPEDGAIDALVGAIGERLVPIYARARAVYRFGELADHLKDHAVSLAQSPWPAFLSGKRRNGLGFCGTQGLSQRRIRAEAELADAARRVLGDVPQAETPLQALRRVRAALADWDAFARQTTGPAGQPPTLWPLIRSKAPPFAEDRRSPWVGAANAADESFLATAARMAPKMFPRPLLPLLALLALTLLGLVHSALGGMPGPVPDCSGGCARIPPWIFDPAPATREPVWILAPGRLALAIGLALLFAVGMGALAAGVRRVFARVRSFGYARMGAVVWFSVAFAAMAVVSSLGLVDRVDVAALALPPAWWLGVAAVGTALMVYARARRGQRWRALPFAALGTFATVTVFALAAHLQLSLFTDSLPGEVRGRWGEASLLTHLLYPTLLAGGLWLAGRGLVESWPALEHPRLRVPPPALFGLLVAAVVLTSFFTWAEVQGWAARWRDWGWQWIVLPGLLASAATLGFAALTRAVSGQKAGRREWLMLGSALTLLCAAALNAGQWAGAPAARLFVSAVLTLPVLLVVGAAGLGLLGLAIRGSERRNAALNPEPETDNIAAIMARENQAAVQNHMSSVVRLVPSPFRRRITLPLALRIIWEGLSNRAYRPGFLGSLGTVQYARWIHLPGTNNYAFYSNYDGSFESYLEDFITKASFGMTGVWSHSVGFPATRFLFFGGSEDGDRFKRYARGSMIPTPFWFSAYPHLSGEQIRRNALIRDGLARVQTPSDASAWLDLFGSASRPDRVIEDDRVQSIMFSGAGKLRFGACLAVMASPDLSVAEFRRWACGLKDTLTYGDRAPRGRATYLALGRIGLDRMGLAADVGSREPWRGAQEHDGEAARVRFPPAFALGMAHPSREAVLGDRGTDAPLPSPANPDGWDWGAGEREAAAVLLVYADTQEALDAALADHESLWRSHDPGGATHTVRFRPLDAPAPDESRMKSETRQIMREPFGFADGISQPVIDGTYHGARLPADSIHRVAPGEFILGYRDNRGFFPPSPEVQAVRDPDGRLPAVAADQPLRYPRFADHPGERRRDLGRNGSFLVIRQLEQDVEAFHATTRDLAERYCPHVDTFQAMNALQAKMVGRWRDGQNLEANPITFSPRADGTLDVHQSLREPPRLSPDNEFLFAARDSQGEYCPLGSHVRRAFPRDGLDPDNPDSLSIANRHRLLRRGRTYEEVRNGKAATGTFFMCLNADIERQFEFVQQTWIGSPKFHGLVDEVDPITGQGVDRRLTGRPESWQDENLPFTIQSRGRELRLEGLKTFVRMRGGGYFFLPSRDALDWMCEGS